MSFEEKTKKAQAELQAAGIWKSSGTPPIYGMILSMGVKIKPPHYCSFGFNFIFSFIWFSTAWGGVMWFVEWEPAGYTLERAVQERIKVALLFGAVLSSYYWYSAKKNRLSKWADL